MALVIKDRIRETSTTSGTGALTLAGAVSGYRSFADVGNGNTTYYAIIDSSTNAWEVGLGTYTASGTSLTRNTVLSNSLGTTALINFSSATKDVFVTYPASKSLYYDDNNSVVINNSNSSDALRITNTGTGNALVVEDSTNPDSTPFVVDASGNVGIGTSSPAAKLDIGSGNLTFSGSAQRITGDFSNATVANRVMFQTSTVNGTTALEVIPSGTSSAALFIASNSSTDPANSSFASIGIVAANTDVRIQSAIRGTGTYLPMTFYTGGSERMRIDTSGNVNIATSGVAAKLYVSGNAAQNISALTDGATITPDFGTANNFSVTLAGNRTLANPTNLVSGQSGVIFISQDATGSRTLAFGTYWDFPNQTVPSLTTTANAVDMLVFTVRSATSIAAALITNIGPL